MTLFQEQNIANRNLQRSFVIQTESATSKGIVVPLCLAQKYLNCAQNPCDLSDQTTFRSLLPKIITCLVTNNDDELEKMKSSISVEEWGDFDVLVHKMKKSEGITEPFFEDKKQSLSQASTESFFSNVNRFLLDKEFLLGGTLISFGFIISITFVIMRYRK